MKIIVKEKERIVIAIIENTRFNAIDYIHSNFKGGFPNLLDVLYLFENDYFISDSYKGVARCHPDDEWDEEKGIKIAKARAIEKNHKAIAKKVERFEKNVEKALRKLKDNTNKKLY